MSRSIEVINGYEIVLRRKKNPGTYDLEVRFLISGNFFTCSRFTGVNVECLSSIINMLDDWTQYNANVEYQCQAIAFPTMVFLINEEVENGKSYD